MHLIPYCLASGLVNCIGCFGTSADEESVQRRICAHSPSSEHWLLEGELEIQRGDSAQMRQMGSSNGTVTWKKVRNYLSIQVSDWVYQKGCY